MKAALFVDGAHVDKLQERFNKTHSARISIDYAKFAAWCADEFGSPSLVYKGYYHALPMKAPNGSPQAEIDAAIRARDAKHRYFEAIRLRAGFKIRKGEVNPIPCKGKISILNQHGLVVDVPCTHVHQSQKRVDTMIVADIVRYLYTQSDIDQFIIVSGDSDMIPALELVHENGKQACVVINDMGSSHSEFYGNRCWVSAKLSDIDIINLRL